MTFIYYDETLDQHVHLKLSKSHTQSWFPHDCIAKAIHCFVIIIWMMDQNLNFIMSAEWSDTRTKEPYVSVVVIYLWDVQVPTCVKYEWTENGHKSAIRERLDQINWQLNVIWVYTGKCHWLLYNLIDTL